MNTAATATSGGADLNGRAPTDRIHKQRRVAEVGDIDQVGDPLAVRRYRELANQHSFERAVVAQPALTVPIVLDRIHIFEKVTCRYGNMEPVDAMYTFCGIVTVDSAGQATGTRWWDFYQPGLDLQRLCELNDAAYDALISDQPELQSMVDYYQFVDEITTIEIPMYAK